MFLPKQTNDRCSRCHTWHPPCCMHGAAGWYPGCSPRLLQPRLHLPAFWDGLHGAVFKGQDFPLPASIAPSRSRWALRFSLWGWTPTLPFPPCSYPQVSWLYLAARTLGLVASKTAIGCSPHYQLFKKSPIAGVRLFGLALFLLQTAATQLAEAICSESSLPASCQHHVSCTHRFFVFYFLNEM